MGVYASNFQSRNQPVESQTQPNKNDWITCHSEATGLSILEVERLWLRFRQLGGTNKGVLRETEKNHKINSDAFVKNIVKFMKNSKNEVSFESFCLAMYWFESAPLEHKVRATYSVINNGKPLTKDILRRVFIRVYPNFDENKIERTAEAFIREMDTKQIGEIDEEDFANWMKRVPASTLENIFKFYILPPEIKTPEFYMERHSKLNNSPDNTQNGDDDYSKQVPTDRTLEEIAELASERDWYYLGNRLGFTQSDLDDLNNRYSDSKLSVKNMLKKWRDREGRQAYNIKLQNALNESNMNDIAMILNP